MIKSSCEFEVRDYECDMQGVVNNSVYQNYLEHARHQLLRETGIDFAEFTKRDIILTVIRVELDYKFPLVSSDRFRIDSVMKKVSPLRILFEQKIYRLPDNKLILTGNVYGTSLNGRRRPEMPAEIDNLFIENTSDKKIKK